jgi:feruloyl esterase
MSRSSPRRPSLTSVAALTTLSLLAVTAASWTRSPAAIAAEPAVVSLEQACRTEVVQAIANDLSGGVAVARIGNGPDVPGGTRYVPATDRLPAYCQVSGSFVTNPQTGKTANFLATFPANWNGKYLQYGCFGTCGSVLLNDAASPLVTIINQGLPGDALRKGYASFGTDEGHVGNHATDWVTTGDRTSDQDALDDYLFRAKPGNRIVPHRRRRPRRDPYRRCRRAA